MTAGAKTAKEERSVSVFPARYRSPLTGEMLLLADWEAMWRLMDRMQFRAKRVTYPFKRLLTPLVDSEKVFFNMTRSAPIQSL